MIPEINFLGNSLKSWILAGGSFALVIFLLRLVQSVGLSRLQAIAQKTDTSLDDLLVEILNKKQSFFNTALALYAALIFLTLPARISGTLDKIIAVAVLIQGGLWAASIISFAVTNYVKKTSQTDAVLLTTINAIRFLSRIAVWTLVLLLILDNLGFDITALIAGLGVGGVAVALAAQNILGDLFSSLSIVLDRPFVIGDFIVVGDLKGTVEYIGLKTTRVRSLSGEELVFSNSDLLQSRIRNFKRMYERRVVFALGVTYETPYQKLQKIPGIIREIIEKQPGARFDRAHFKDYGDFSLNFEAVYYFKSSDYNPYMDCHQAVNLEIFRRFQQEKIDFAYPTKTLYVHNVKGENA